MKSFIEVVLSKIPYVNRRLDPHMQEIVVGTLVALILRVVGTFLGFCFTLLLAKTCGAEGAGAYYLALTVATIASVLGRLGLDNSMLRFVAANSGTGDWAAVKGVSSIGIKLCVMASTASSVVLFLFAPLLASGVFHKPEMEGPLRWIAISVVPMSLLNLYSQMLRGLKRIQEFFIVSGIGVPLALLLGTGFFGKKWGVGGVIGSYVLASVATAGLGFWLWRSATPHLRGLAARFDRGDLMRSSIPLFWVSGLSFISGWASTFFLGIWGTKQEIGIFGAASRAAMLMNVILLAVNSISAPKFSELYKKNDIRALDSLARYTAQMMTLAALPPLVLFLAFPGLIMGMFGSDFLRGAPELSILAAGQFVNVATGSVGILLMMSGNEKLVRNNSVFIASLTIVLNVVLIPLWGPLGAAIATATCVVAGNLVCAYLVWSKLGIRTISFFP